MSKKLCVGPWKKVRHADIYRRGVLNGPNVSIVQVAAHKTRIEYLVMFVFDWNYTPEDTFSGYCYSFEAAKKKVDGYLASRDDIVFVKNLRRLKALV